MTQRILITGGAGFIGSNLGLALKRDHPDAEVVALDSLHRRGSELALDRLREGGVSFVRGDVRNPEDLEAVGVVDILLECSAEPSVQAGYGGDARYLIDTNLVGTVNCLEFARGCGAGVVFLSTSRVYPIAALRALPLEPRGERLVLPENREGPGWSARGITPDFPMAGSRSLYGATKLCSELLMSEYRAMYDLPIVINRCGVVAGPWQLGRVDQGFVALWAARHAYGGELSYRGFDGKGLQVRDVLHVDDLYDLIAIQLARLEDHSGRLYSVGGGPERSVSLRELTALCAEATGNRLEIGSDPDTHPADIPYYVADNRDVTTTTGWQPQRSIGDILDDVLRWLNAHRGSLEKVFC
jgi:CDP-paratose 2-epimerase